MISITFPERTVSLLEIVRSYVELYTHASYVFGAFTKGNQNVDLDLTDILSLIEQLSKLREECSKASLPMTVKAIDCLLTVFVPENQKYWRSGGIKEIGLRQRFVELQGRLDDELATRFFIHVVSDRVRYFDNPRHNWEEVIDRWQETAIDIEEMGKCFALCRYAAAVYHSTQTIEIGLLKLGQFIGVPDPKSGWTAVTNKLEGILKTKYQDRTDFEKINSQFIEQVHGTIAALKNAWRNKIDHVQGRTVLMTSEFMPDVAEEIIMASRAFMRRLATEMPK